MFLYHSHGNMLTLFGTFLNPSQLQLKLWLATGESNRERGKNKGKTHLTVIFHDTKTHDLFPILLLLLPILNVENIRRGKKKKERERVLCLFSLLLSSYSHSISNPVKVFWASIFKEVIRTTCRNRVKCKMRVQNRVGFD